jgi:hypothetical protein
MLDLDHPCWRDHCQLLRRLGLDTVLPGGLPAVAELNGLLDQKRLQKAGKPIRFVAAEQLPAVVYEEHIYHDGEISTRKDNWHDLFNALAWVRFPGIKAAMNACHFAEIQRGNTVTRGPVRDALTLFDESGVVVVGDRQAPLQALAERNWQQLFCEHRSAWQYQLRVFIVGHALLERFLNPYKSLTAQVMIFHAGTDFMQREDGLQSEQLDQFLAAQVRAGLRLRSSAELSPLPLMGIPGWCLGAPQDDDFYADERVFRRPVSGSGPALISPLGIGT